MFSYVLLSLNFFTHIVVGEKSSYIFFHKLQQVEH